MTIPWDFVLEFFYFAYWDFLWRIFYWDFLWILLYLLFVLWHLYWTYYQYYFLGLFSYMGFFPLFPVCSFDSWEVVFAETVSKYPNLLLSHQGRCWRLLDILQISAELFCRIDILLNFFSLTPHKPLQGLERTFYSHLVASTQLPFWGKITEIL